MTVHAGLPRPALRLIIVVAIVAAALAIPVFLFLTAKEVTCGTVVSIDQPNLTLVRGFTLRAVDGTDMTFRVEQARLAKDSFVPGHLREHLALSSPVCVTHAQSDTLALDLRDGPP
ncbi:MAG: hypothetical protein M3067_10010 [Chloroflexota bacterium]|nr:hypothetical protein [Chloroflexota bacterium]